MYDVVCVLLGSHDPILIHTLEIAPGPGAGSQNMLHNTSFLDH